MSDSTCSLNFDFSVCLVSTSSWLHHNLLQVTDLEEEVLCCIISLTIVLTADDGAVTFLCLGVFKKSSNVEELTCSANCKTQRSLNSCQTALTP